MRSQYVFLAISLAISCFITQPTLAQDPVETTTTTDAGYWYPVFKNGKLGYIDNTGKLRINAELNRIESYKLDNITTDFIKVEVNQKMALYNRAAKLVLDPKYTDIIIDKQNKLFRVSQAEDDYSFMNDLVGYLDFQGNTVIPVSYHTQMFSAGYGFHEGLWCFTKDDLQGYMDTKGKIIIAPQFHASSDFLNSLAAVQPDSKAVWGYIDKSGKFKIPASFASAGAFDEAGYALVRIKAEDPTLSIINRTGKVVSKNIPYKATGSFMTGAEFHKGLFVVYDSVTKKYGFMDHNGKLAIPMQFDYAQDFTDDGRALVNMGSITDGKGFLATHIGGKWGFIDTRGNMTIPYLRAEELGTFTEGRCPVKMNGLWGFIDETGAVAIEPRWKERPAYFDGGLARVYEKSKLPAEGFSSFMAIGYIDKQGKYIWPIQE